MTDRENPIWRVLAWMVLFFLLAPVLVTFPVSVTDNSYLSFPKDGISFQYYNNVLTDPAWIEAAVRSAIVACMAALVATLVAGMCAYACWQLGGRVAALVQGLIMLPMIVPPIVSALGFHRVLVRLGLFDTYPGVILAHTVLVMPFVFICVAASLALFEDKLIHAARSLGASRIQAAWKVLIPSILPGLLSGALFAFITSWDEVVVLLFITSRQVVLLPRELLQGIQDDVDPTIAAVAALLVMATTVGVGVAAVFRKRAERAAQV